MQDGLNHLLLNNPYAYAVFIVAFWCFVCFAISLFSGWLTLSRRFRMQSEPNGDTRSAGPFFYTVYMRFWCHYNSVIRIIVAEDAVYLSVIFLFRFGHPPLRIPWNEIRISETKWFFRRCLVLTCGEPERIPVRISVRMARNLGILERLPNEMLPNGTSPT